jgi:hypothetical protein
MVVAILVKCALESSLVWTKEQKGGQKNAANS